MIIQAILFLVGLVGLTVGAEWLIRGGARLARSFGLTALVVGLTVVAFGTSAPELVVSSLASARGQGDMAIGNVVGSNIVNIALILGLAAIVNPMQVDRSLVRRDIPVMIGAGVLLGALVLDGTLSRLDGAVLLAIFAVNLVHSIATARRSAREGRIAAGEVEGLVVPAPSARMSSTGLVLLGLLALIVGAQLLVGSAVFFARTLGISELVIGLTIVAIGTSLPEMATSIIAAVRRENDIALGNIVGSNLFNTLAILGVAALVNPLPVASSIIRFDLPFMLIVSAALLPLAWTGLRLSRGEGGLLFASYALFAYLLLDRAF